MDRPPGRSWRASRLARLLAFGQTAVFLSWSSLNSCGISREMPLEPSPTTAIDSDFYTNRPRTYCSAHWIGPVPTGPWRASRLARLPVLVGTARNLLLCSLDRCPSTDLELVPRPAITVLYGIYGPTQ